MARPRGHRLSPNAFELALDHAGINLTETAERAEIPRATLSGLLGGHARASVPIANRLALALGVKADAIFPTLRACFTEVEDAA